MFQCFNVASIGPAISFLSFDVSHKRRWGGYIIIITLNSCSILVFFVATESDSLYISGPCFNVLMWPVLVLQFHFEVLKFPALVCDIMSCSSINDARPLWKITFPQWTLSLCIW